MDEKKLAQMIRNQRPVPDAAFDQRYARDVERIVRGVEPMKKKMSVLAIAVAVLLSLTLLGLAAELMGVNVFEIFGQYDQRLDKLAGQAMLRETPPVTVTNPEMEESDAWISNAYYDGQTLIVGYAIRNRRYAEPYTPTAEQLARMTKTDTEPADPLAWQGNGELYTRWEQALANGVPFGYIEYYINYIFQTLTAEGTDLGANGESVMWDEVGTEFIVRNHAVPLPREAQDKESLNIVIPLQMLTRYRYFDGINQYAREEVRDLEPITATVWRADASVRKFAGTLTFAGHEVHVSVEASAASVVATLTMKEGDFPSRFANPKIPADYLSYSIALRDQNLLELEYFGADLKGTANMLFAELEGTGEVPEKLEMQLRVVAPAGVFLPPELAEVINVQLSPID